MEISIRLVQLSQDGPLYILRGQDIMFKHIAFISLNIKFDPTNSVDTDEIPHGVAFYLGLHCLTNSRLGLSNLQRVKY